MTISTYQSCLNVIDLKISEATKGAFINHIVNNNHFFKSRRYFTLSYPHFTYSECPIFKQNLRSTPVDLNNFRYSIKKISKTKADFIVLIISRGASHVFSLAPVLRNIGLLNCHKIKRYP